MNKASNYYLRKFDRILAWSLMVLFIIFTVAGYGIINPKLIIELTGGILTHSNALLIHTTLDVPILVLLTIHVLIQLRFTLIRWGIKDGILLNTFIIILGAFCAVLLLVMDGLVPL